MFQAFKWIKPEDSENLTKILKHDKRTTWKHVFFWFKYTQKILETLLLNFLIKKQTMRYEFYSLLNPYNDIKLLISMSFGLLWKAVSLAIILQFLIFIFYPERSFVVFCFLACIYLVCIYECSLKEVQTWRTKL